MSRKYIGGALQNSKWAGVREKEAGLGWAEGNWNCDVIGTKAPHPGVV